MKPRELLKLPTMKVTKLMKERAEETMMQQYNRGPSKEFPRIKWFYKAKKTKDILEIAVFTNQLIRKGCEYPRYRIFLYENEYRTWDNVTNGWKKARIEKLDYFLPEEKHTYWCPEEIFAEEKDRQLIIRFTSNGREDIRESVQIWQEGSANRTEMDEIDAHMNLVPKIPEDFKKWEKKEAIPQYIFYDAGRKVTEGYCTHCEHVVPVDDPKYNKEGICKRCGHKIIYKSRKKGGNIIDWVYAGLLQKTPEGYVYRHFEIRAQYVNAQYYSGNAWETIRIVMDNDFNVIGEYEYGQWKQTNLYRWRRHRERWNYMQKCVDEHQTVLYPRNLKKLLNGTKLQYSGLPEFAKSMNRFYLTEFIECSRRYPGMEKLIKCGFMKLARSAMRRGQINYLDMHQTKVKRVLNLDGYYFKLAQGKDITYREYEVMQEAIDADVTLNYQQAQYLSRDEVHKRNFCIYIRHTTPHKMIRYMKEKLNADFVTYHDYLQLAAGLGYNLDDEYVLFPKDVKRRHDELVEERNERDERIRKAKADEKAKLYAEAAKKENWQQLEMESDDLLIRIPESPEEIRKEGQAQHHCVATYVDRMIKGDTCILFVRKKIEPEKSYFTVEVIDEKIVQVRGKYNCAATEDVDKFMKLFEQKKLRRERMVR